MAELYIFDQDDKLLTIINEETGLLSTQFREELNHIPDTPFVFSVEADIPKAKYIVEENQVVFRDTEGDLRLFRIKEIDDQDNIDGPVTTATCEPACMELNDHIIVDRRFVDKQAQEAIDAALEGTRWTGTVEVELSTATTNFYYISSIEGIWNILQVWGGDFKDVVTFDSQNNITSRQIRIKQRLGADHGKRFEIDHNTTEIGRTVLSYPVTALYGRGASLPIEDDEGEHTGGYTRYIDFADVVWSKANGDPVDKPKGQRWVGDPNALKQYGYLQNGKRLHRYGIWQNQDIEDPAELLRATWEQLETAQKPEVNYRLSVDLFDQKVSLGDTARAIDRQFARPIEIQARVVAVEYDLLDVEGTMVVEMGQLLNLDDDRLDRVIETINRNQGKWDSGGTITRGRFPDIKPSKPANLRAEGGFEAIQLYWDYADELYIDNYEVYGSQVKDFVPDSQHLLWRGKVSAFAHWVERDQVWYYRVRAVNYHGRPSDWSDQVSASTHRVISDDILFGPDLAERLRELNRISDIIGVEGVRFENISQHARDLLEQEARRYTDTEIRAVEEQINAELAEKAGLDYVNGKFSFIDYDIDLINSNIAQINVNVDSISTRVSSLQSSFDGLEIGGRNLLRNSGFEEGTDHWSVTGNINIPITDGYIGLKGAVNERRNYDGNDRRFLRQTNTSNLVLLAGETYTLSGWFYIDSSVTFDSTNSSIFVRKYQAGSSGTFHDLINVPVRLVDYDYDTWHYFESTGTVREDYSGMEQIAFALGKNGRVIISGWKLEKGNKATDWTPAPEDTIDRLVKAETRIDQNAHAISLKAEKTQVDAIEGEITNVAYDLSQLTIGVNGIQSQVLSLRSDLDNLEIGGRNYIRNSEGNGWIAIRAGVSSDITTGVKVEEWGASNAVRMRLWGVPSTSQVVKATGRIDGGVSGETYTFSQWIWNVGSNPMRININGLNGVGSETIAPGEMKRVVHTGTWRFHETASHWIQAQYSTMPNQEEDEIEFVIWRAQLEKGNHASDWSPAPEDAEARITRAETLIDQNAQQIALRATKTEVNSLAGRMTQAEAELVVLADEINLKVDVDGIVSAINLSQEGIRIKGSLIHLDGLTLIDSGIIKTAHIDNAAITRAKLDTAVIGTAQIEDLAVTSAKIASVNADKINAASLSAISANLGTVTAGILRSNNNTTTFNLNTGNLSMTNADFTLGNGAKIVFTNVGNTISFSQLGPNNFYRTAGLGIGSALGGDVPFAYLGTTPGGSLDSLHDSFTGFITNTAYRISNNNSSNSVVGNRFRIRDMAYDKGLVFDWFGTPTITLINGSTHNYELGSQNGRFNRFFCDEIRGAQAFNIRNYFNGLSGWLIETNYSGGGSDITFRGLNGGSYNYQIGGSADNHRIRNIYLRNSPDVRSDERLKEDITNNPLGLSFIRSVETKRFRLKHSPADQSKNLLQFGVVAQQLIQTLEDEDLELEEYSIISRGEDGMYGVQYEQLIAPTIKAVQELDTKLENEVNWLKVENQLLRVEIKQLKEKIA
ncbi:phage tail spike protein [Halalkalibacterium halodurans]|uniref:phage tail spike protein n=1 Tax=Halalkalibacterium halodurans TaxID=86665 RepID=UPI001585EDA8|nr:phage tail spike protein [Halalkalibacterium halodurans]